jgi:hypothetical protein
MTTLLLERAPTPDEGLECGTRRWLDGVDATGRTRAHGRLTLGDLITGVWEGLAVRAVRCPVCAGEMTLDHREDPGAPPSATCAGCGSRLS